MIQVASENFNNQENFLGLGKKNKAKRQEKRAVRKEKRAAKKKARQGKSIIGKIANRVGIGKQAKEIRKDVKTAKSQIRTTGTFTRGSVSSGIIRKTPSTRFGGVSSGKPITPFRGGLVRALRGSGVQKIPTPVSEPVYEESQHGNNTPYQEEIYSQPKEIRSEPRNTSRLETAQDTQQVEQVGQSAQAEQVEQVQAEQAQAEQAQAEEKNPDGTPKEKPFNWKLWGGIGGGIILIIIVVVVVIVLKKKK